jgi:molybdopterin synthase sulfur carrier subunit
VSAVKIPSVLRPAVGGARELDIEGGTIRELIAQLTAQHPNLRQQLLADDGGLNRFVNVYVNGQDVRYLQGLDTHVEARDEVRLLPAMAGG